MAIKPSKVVLDTLNESRRAKQEELGRAYAAMGGRDTALVPNYASNNPAPKASIPKLEKAISNLYQTTQNAGRSSYNDLQAMSGTYNDIANERTERKLKNIKQENYAPVVAAPTLMGVSNGMYGQLTPEMQSAGLTLDDLKRYSGNKARRTYEDVTNQMGKDHPVLSTALAAAEQPVMSLGNVAKNVKNYALGKPIENNFNAATALRQSVADNNIDTKVGNFAYGVGNSMADMLIASLAGANVGPGIMGLEKADQVMNSAVDRGLTPNQIVAEGIGSGITTAATEAIPFKEFKAGDNILRSMRNEGIQEGAEDIADTILDTIVTQIGGNPEKSELAIQYQAYRDAGYSEEDAKKAVLVDYLKQLGLDAAAGAISGGGMGGVNNVSQGYNFFTGRGNVNAEANADENVKTDTEQTIPTLDSRAEEANIQARREEELAQFKEAYAQRQAEEQKQTQSVQQEVVQPKEQLPVAEQPIQQTTQPEVQIPKVEQQAQPTQIQPEQPTIPSLTNRQLAQYTRQVEGLIDKLGMFNNKSFNKSLNNALKAVQNTQGEEQQNAIARLNNLVNQIDEQMAGSEIGTSQRTINQDMYDDMKRVTDGYVIKVNDNMLDELGLTLKQLNDRVNTTAKNGVNHIRFVKGNSGTPIDSVYNELYELSNHQLPDPRSMAEGDQLKAVYDYVTRSKAGKNEMAQTATWENVPVLENRAKAETDMESRADAILDKIAKGTVTDEDYADFQKFYNDSYWKNFDKPYINAITDMEQEVRQAYTDYMKNAHLDEDVQNIKTVGEALTTLNDEISGIPMDLTFHGRNNRGEVKSEDSDRVQTGRYKTSEVYTNSAEKSGNLTDEQRRMVEQNGSMLYQENSWKESVAEAEKRILEGGWQTEFEKLTGKDAKSFNNVDVDELFMLWRHFKEQAVALDKRGLDSTSAWQKTVDCLTQLKAAGSSAGSELNAFKKWSMNNTPEGLMAEAEIIIDEYINGISEGAKKLAKKSPWLERIVKETKGKTRQMDVGFIKQFLTEAEKLAPTHTVQEGETLSDIAKAYNTTVDALIELNGKDIKPGDTITVSRLDMDSNEARQIMANLGKMVNTQIPVSLREKITTLLMDNMLGNFRTLITRNAGGNLGYNLIEQKITKNLAAKIDKTLSEKRGTARNISENTSEGRQAYREGFKEAFKQEWFDLTHNLRTARSGENNLRTAVSNNRTIFNEKGPLGFIGKVGNFYDRLVRSGLSVGDRPFYEGVYKQYMTEYKKMFDQGLLGNMKEEEFNELAQVNAQIKALEAVYQDDSDMAEAFMAAKNFVSLASKGLVGADILSQFTMPFVKTPANIIERAIEYSPLGLVKNAVQTVRELRHTMTANELMDFDQQRFATETARNLVGTIMFGLAVIFANAGGMTGAYDDDPDMAQAQRESGMQEYALHLPINGGVDVDISSMPVIGNDLVAAAAAYDAFRNNPELTTLQRISKGLSAGIGKQFETSTLQGLQRLFGTGSSYGYGKKGEDGTILDQAKDTIKSGATQLIPSLLRQFAGATDPYQRRLTGVNEDDYYINNLRSAIPWLRQNLQPKIGRTGEVLEQNHAMTTAGRWFNNFINPFNVTYGTEDAVRDEAMRLHESTGNSVAFQPFVSLKELTTEDHIPTPEEFTQYQQNAYGAMNQIATDVINSDYYQSLSDGDKEALLADIYSAVKSVEKANILGTDKSNLSGAAKAYDNGGAQGLIDYLTAAGTLEQFGLSNNEQNREVALQALSTYGQEGMQQVLSQYQSQVSREGMDLDVLMNNQYKDMLEMLSDDTLTELRGNINSTINGVEANSALGNVKDYEGSQAAYNNGGINGLAEYMFPAAILKQYGMTNNEKNREMILNAYNEGGANAVQQIIQASQTLGNDSNLTYKYEHATNYLPSLSPTQFQTTWNAINTDGNTSIKIDEMIDYLNQNPGAYDSDTALQYWNAFYTGTSEKIPVLVNGRWEAKKA